MEQIQEELSSVIDLNVGGTKFTTRLSTLRKYPESMLAVMFSGRHELDRDKDGNYFIDRNGEYFHYIINYLRDNQCSPPEVSSEKVLREAEYFGLYELADCLKERPPLFPSVKLLEETRKTVEDNFLIKERVKEIAKFNAVNDVKTKVGTSVSKVKLVTYTSEQYIITHFLGRPISHPYKAYSFAGVMEKMFDEKDRSVMITIKNELIPDFTDYISTISYDLKREGYRLSVHTAKHDGKNIPRIGLVQGVLFNDMMYKVKHNVNLEFNWELIPKTCIT